MKPSSSLLKPLREAFERFLRQNISCLGEKNRVRDACEFSLLNGGKRVRPLIVMSVAKALGHKLSVLEVGLSVEYFHTASLIADDLPCMDNEDFRRERPALHKIYGEAVAILASYALISAGYEKIFRGVQFLLRQRSPFKERASEICVVALDSVVRGAGISGAVGGQYKDLFSQETSLEGVLEIIHQKSVTLFEVAFVFGWIFGGGDLAAVERVRSLAYHFGMAFQIADDLCDVHQRGESPSNLGMMLGKEGAYALFENEVEEFTRKLQEFEIMTPEFCQIAALLTHYANTGA